MSILAPFPSPSQEPDGANALADVTPSDTKPVGAPPYGNAYIPAGIETTIVEKPLLYLLQQDVETAKLFVDFAGEVWHPLRLIDQLEHDGSNLLYLHAKLTWNRDRRPGDDFGTIEVFERGRVILSYRLTL